LNQMGCSLAYALAAASGLQVFQRLLLLLRNSFHKRMQHMPQKKSGSPRRKLFLLVSVPIFFSILTTATLITFILPESYMSAARVRTGTVGQAELPTFIPTRLAILNSSNVLDQVIEKLNLNETWGRKYNNNAKLKTSESKFLLERMLEHYQVPHTNLFEVRCYSDDKDEAASIANAVAEAYRDIPLPSGQVVHTEIIEKAVPNPKPARPNKPVNIAVGGILGLLAGSSAGLIVVWLVSWRARKKAMPPPIPTNLAAR
jgi:uncharacterized protein involved in exopolysaccharide biosynthesis